MINKVTLIGNTGRDSEVRVLENGTQVCSFSVATTESYKDKNDQWQDQTEWHNVVVWRPSQNVASLPKGAKVYIEGKISYRKYKDKEGIDRMTTDIVASVVRRLDPAKNAAAPNTAPNVDTSNVNMDTNVDSSGNGGFNPLDELPF